MLLSDGRPYERNGVQRLFERLLLDTDYVRGAVSFEVHAVGFGSEVTDWDNLRPLAEVTGGTFQASSFDQLELRQAFTSITATITADRSSLGAVGLAPLRAAAMEIPFDPVCFKPSGCEIPPT